MKCIFNDELCVRGGFSHDDCRKCRLAPDMIAHGDIEYRCLCAVGGQREKQTKYYGSSERKKPRWLKDIIKKNDGLGDFIPCTDHRRYLDSLVINEPYNIHMSDVKKLIKYCEENDLSFTIDGDSAHFPGGCFRILITKLTQQAI